MGSCRLGLTCCTFAESKALLTFWQAGDSFDVATVLCSLLIGAGYDAYVAMGYAPLFVTANNQTKNACPSVVASYAAQTADAAAPPPVQKPGEGQAAGASG